MVIIPRNKPFKILSSEQLNTVGLDLYGYANFSKAQQTLTEHTHSCIEFIALLKGTQRYTVDSKEYLLHGGDVFITYPFESHSTGSSPQDVAEIIWFQISLDRTENFLGLSAPHSIFLFNRLKALDQRIIHAEIKDIRQLRDAFTLFESANPQKALLGHCLLIGFLTRYFCIDHDKKVYSSDTESHRTAEMAEKYIVEHLCDNPDLETIAKVCSVSYTQLNAVFKKQKGVTPHTFIINKKLELAKKLLCDHENSVTDISYMLGFSSSDYFSTVFKKYTGITPTQFRNLK